MHQNVVELHATNSLPDTFPRWGFSLNLLNL
jgi:hypothetical protein